MFSQTLLASVIGGLFVIARVRVINPLPYQVVSANEIDSEEVGNCLRKMKPALRNAPSDLLFQIDEHSLALGCNFTFDTPLGDLHLIGYLEPLSDSEAILPSAETIKIGGLKIKVIGLDDLIKIRQYIRRPWHLARPSAPLSVKASWKLACPFRCLCSIGNKATSPRRRHGGCRRGRRVRHWK